MQDGTSLIVISKGCADDSVLCIGSMYVPSWLSVLMVKLHAVVAAY